VQDAAAGSYDVIIVDSSDPVGPAEVLYQRVRWTLKIKSCQKSLGSRVWQSHRGVLITIMSHNWCQAL
jgi:spermidine synthase